MYDCHIQSASNISLFDYYYVVVDAVVVVVVFLPDCDVV